MFPLKNFNGIIPNCSNHPGSFGSIRSFDIHTGIDLYCHEGDSVFAIEDGIVKDIIEFTGSNANSPWWNNTYAIVISSKSGDILYGELLKPKLNIGDEIFEGELIGHVTTVLKKDKGLPMTMLHIELYTVFIEAVTWELTKPKPQELENPFNLLYFNFVKN